MAADNLFNRWAILELMGHVRIAGRVSEEEHFGAKLGRIDIPGPDAVCPFCDGKGGVDPVCRECHGTGNAETFTTQYFGGASVYRLTPTTEEIARHVAKSSQPEPVYCWDRRRQVGLVPESPPRPPAFDEDDEPADEDIAAEMGHQQPF